MARGIQSIKGLLEDFRYAWKERNNPYVDNDALKARYEESRKLYEEKMNNAFSHHTNNDLTKTFDELFSAVNCLDTSNLWEKKSRLAKNINDNKDNLPLTLWATLISYGTSIGAGITTIPTISVKGYNAPSDPFFWGGLVGFFILGIVGIYQQKRLKRLVKEHKDYTKEYEETTELIERKKDL